MIQMITPLLKSVSIYSTVLSVQNCCDEIKCTNFKLSRSNDYASFDYALIMIIL